MHLIQPPLGGCVLKPKPTAANRPERYPAAFRRLCVETVTSRDFKTGAITQPPLGGCVLKPPLCPPNPRPAASRL